MSIAAWSRRRGVRLFHFTDASNIPKIIELDGLWSWWTLEQAGHRIPRPGGTAMSRELDLERKLHDHVRLCFVDDHQMAYVARREGRIPNPVYLPIKLEALDLPGVLFSDRNATDGYADFGAGLDWFANNIDWDLIVEGEYEHPDTGKFYDFSRRAPMFGEAKALWQAEALIPRHLPLSYVDLD